jgi:hypothetical protein
VWIGRDWCRFSRRASGPIWTNLDLGVRGGSAIWTNLDRPRTKLLRARPRDHGPQDHGTTDHRTTDHGPQDHGPRTTGPRTARGGANWVPGQGKKFNVRIGSGWFGSAGVSSAVGFFFRTIKKAESVFREFQFGPRGVKVKLREIK